MRRGICCRALCIARSWSGTYFQVADKARGRFRTFLLASFDRFIIDEFRAQTALARRCSGGVVALEEVQLDFPALIEVEPLDRDWGCVLR